MSDPGRRPTAVGFRGWKTEMEARWGGWSARMEIRNARWEWPRRKSRWDRASPRTRGRRGDVLSTRLHHRHGPAATGPPSSVTTITPLVPPERKAGRKEWRPAVGHV